MSSILTNNDDNIADIPEGEPTLDNAHLDFSSMTTSIEPSRSSIDIEMDDLSQESLLTSPSPDGQKNPNNSAFLLPDISIEPPSNDEDFGIVQHRTGKPAPAIANLTNCILAAGAVEGSYALSQSGLFLGLIAYVVIGSLMDYSLNLLVREANITKVYDYKELCKKGYGWWGYAAITFAQWGQSYGSMVSYLIIATDTFLSLSQLLTGDGEPLVSRSILAIMLVAVIVLPLSFLKSVSAYNNHLHI